jgi:Sec-independent protein translocase protein TatA
MEFLNIGGLELLLILVVALVALGPERIVKIGHALGNTLRKLGKNVLFREVVQTTDEIRNYPRKILDEAKLDMADLDISKQIRQDYEIIDQEKDEIRSYLQNDLPECNVAVQNRGERDDDQSLDGPNEPIGP